MKKLLLREAAKHKLQERRRKRWQKTVSILACLVVFCTVYALILPALTAEADTYCGKEEHTHTEDCYEEKLICGKEEGEGAHHHTDDCYREVEALVCQTPESDGHQHTDACYTEEQVLTCTNTEEGHVHSEFEGCYTIEKKLTCGMEEGEGAHHHTAECYEKKKELICGQQENDGHRHTAECYKKELICGKEEHTHTLACYSNPDADVENGDVWQNTVSSVTLTGNWGADLAATAQTQTGYTESTANYAVAEDGQTIHGYTRYGAWANDPYRDNWSAQFADFCLSYAGVPTSAVPQNSDCSAWNYTNPDGYTPKTGDLLLLDTDLDSSADHAGIVTSADDSTLTAIVGDADKAVRNNTYNIGSDNIKGYVSIPENPAMATPTPEPTKEAEVTPEAQPTQEPEATPEVTEEPTQEPENKADDAVDKADENKTQDEDVKEDDGKKDDTANNIEVTPTPEVTETPEVTPIPTETPDQDSDIIKEEKINWCIVEQDIAVQNTDEKLSAEPIMFDDIEEDELTVQSNESFVLAANADSSTSVKLDDYITNINLKKLSNGNWSDLSGTDTLKDGDKVLVDISYSVNGGLPDGKYELTYQLPANIALSESLSGPVTQKGVEVGSYTIEKDGNVVITLDQSKFNPNESFTGKFQFEGTANRLGNQDEEKIVFPGSDKEIIIKKDKSQYDLTTKKEAKLSADYKSIDYTITVSSEAGTGSDLIQKIEDSFNRYNNTAVGSYRKNSFKVVKIDANGQKTDVNKSPVFTDEDTKFTYSDLEPLGSGEKYVVSYTADVTENSQKGGGSISNSAGVQTTGNKSSWDSKTVTIPGVMIEKTGYYDQNTNKITWTVTLNKDAVADMAGYSFKDILPEGVTLSNGISDISVTPVCDINPQYNSETRTITATFPSNAGKQKYTITYTTTAPTVGAGQTQAVSNTAEIGKDGKTYTASGTVSVSPRQSGITKKWSADISDETGTKYQWYSELSLPEDVRNEVTYSDTILPATDKQGNDVADTHYGIASELKTELEKELLLKTKDGKEHRLTDIQSKYDVTFAFYTEKDGEPISFNDSTKKVKYFTVKISSKDSADKVDATSVSMKYYTHIDYSQMSEGEEWTFRNKGEYAGKESEGSHSYKKPSKLVKQVGVKDSYGNITYGETSFAVNYDDTHGYLYYRLFVRPANDENGDIVINDELSDKSMSYDVSSVDTKFYFNEWNSGYECWVSHNHKYNLLGEEKPTVSISSDSGKQKLKIEIKPGYKCTANQNHDGFLVTYRVKISGDSAWNTPGTVKKVYGNSVSWRNVTTSTSTLVEKDEAEEVEKKGTQRTSTNKDGKTVYSDIVDYSVVINPTAKDLIPEKDEVELVDKLTFEKDGIKAYLELDSLKLYTYDHSAEGHLGNLLDRSKYKVKYDDSNPKAPVMTVTVPDELACVLVYTYTFDRGTIADNTIKVKNSANLEGGYSGSTSTEVQKNSASASVDQGNVTIYKVDVDDYSIRLSGAKFTLEAYDVTSQNWENADITINTGCQASKSKENGKTVYKTGADGYLKFDTDTGMSGTPDNKLLQTDTVYKLTEIEAPIGYQISSEPYYFVFLRDKKENDFTSVAPLKGINKNVYYYDDGKAVNMTVSNKFAGVSVRKVWQNQDGTIVNKTDGTTIKVQLYRSKMVNSSNAHKVTIKYFSSHDNNLKYTDTIYVKRDTGIKILWPQEWNSGELDLWKIPEGCAIGIKDNADRGYPVITIPGDKVTDELNIECSYYEGASSGIPVVTYQKDKIWSLREKVGDEVSLSSTNNWLYTWNNVEANSDDSEKWYYTVQEVSGSDGYDVSYTNNDGVEVGKSEIVITNKEREKSYILPETGGTGTNRFTAMGLALMAGSLMCGYVMRRKRRERRRN